jgi:hypothetical protein
VGWLELNHPTAFSHRGNGHHDNPPPVRFTSLVRFYGFHDRDEHEVIEFYPCREAAERELAEILHEDEHPQRSRPHRRRSYY